MGYLFLTGATGLLGSYLTRDLLARGTKLALLVRGTKWATARQRVDSLLERWEKQAGYALPRPVVLEGNLSDPELGLGPSGVRWARDNCTAFMHNAASLTFQGDGRDTEPYISNLGGTRNVLDFCQAADIKQFHHVSTAYVCGLRRGEILESELDAGQQHGNDYEISKFESEQMVRDADFPGGLTVYRPGIILGDSRDGFTTTFHGFYVPLKLVSSLITQSAGLDVSEEMLATGIKLAGQRLREILQLNGDERKNFVPVDWVSAVMSHVYTHAEHHGKTYHLTPPSPVPVAVFQRVMEEMFLKYARIKGKAKATNVDWNEFEKFFLDQMQVYRSYWGDDPDFDSTNTQAAAPHLPCPRLDDAMFRRMCEYAIESNFGWPRPPVVKPEFDTAEHLADLTASEVGASDGVQLGLQVNGLGGGQWAVQVQDGRPVSAVPGINTKCSARFYMNSQTFERLATGETQVDDEVRNGRVLIEGNGLPGEQLRNILAKVANKQTEAS